MRASRASTLTEVARRAGVSVTTASKAINGQARISEQTRARVLKAARELSYSPNPMARSLISGRSGIVGLIVVDSQAQRFVVPIMLGAEAALSEIDLSLIITDARGDVDRFASLARSMERRMVDGILVVGDDNARTPSLNGLTTVPTVYVYGETGHTDHVVHVPNDRAGAVMVAEHVVALGRRRIAHICGPRGTRATRERVRGLREVLRGHGLEPLVVQHGPWSQLWGRSAAAQLLVEHPDVDAVICASDQIAYGVVEAVLESGRRVPEDVAVTGFDNWGIFADETRPLLTTVDPLLDDLGGAAVRDLFSVIDGHPVGGGIRQHRGRLVVRGSTDRSVRDAPTHE